MGLNATIPDEIDEVVDGLVPSLFRDAPSSVSFNKLRKRLLRQVRQAFDDFGMLKDQKRWLVGLSGGQLFASRHSARSAVARPASGRAACLQSRSGTAEFPQTHPA